MSLRWKVVRSTTENANIYGLLTKCEIKMAGKKERDQYPAISTEQTWSIKDLLYGFWGNFSCGIQRVVPRGQGGSILPARVANHSTRFESSCPLLPGNWTILTKALWSYKLI